MSFYITLKCDKIINQLDKEIRLRGEWEVGIVQSIVNSKADDPPLVWIICDLVEYSNYNSIPLQLLGVINTREANKVINNKPYYTRLARKRFTNINIIFKLDPENDSNYFFQDLYLRLHFRKR